MKKNNFYAKILNDFLDAVFPIECIFCGRNFENLPQKERWICPDCFKRINFRKEQVCPVCEKANFGGEVHGGCKKYTNLDGVWVCLYYDDIIEKAVHHFKFKFIKDLSYLLSKAMFVSLNEVDELGEFHEILMSNLNKREEGSIYINQKEDIEDTVFLVPVPLYKKRYNWRGFNQSELLAREISNNFKIISSDKLKRIKNTKPQSGTKDKFERRENIKGAFACKNDNCFSGKNVILVDDLCTTLSTLNECGLELKRNGAKKVWGLVLARR